MAKMKRSESSEPGGSWLDTYADMVTLLLTFFVLLYSMSTTDDSKWQLILQAFESWGSKANLIITAVQDGDQEYPAIGDIEGSEHAAGDEEQQGQTDNQEELLAVGSLPATFDQLYQYLKRYVDEKGLGDSVAVEKGDTYAYLRFQDKIFFGGDSSTLLNEGKTLLEGISPGLQSVEHLMLGIKVFGHTADFQHSPVDEWDLSAARANSVRRYMVQLGISDNSKYTVTGFGKNRPIASNDTEEGRTMNRRVEIIILRNDVDMSNPDVIRELAKLDYSLEIFDPEQPDEGEDETNEESLETSVVTETSPTQ